MAGRMRSIDWRLHKEDVEAIKEKNRRKRKHKKKRGRKQETVPEYVRVWRA